MTKKAIEERLRELLSSEAAMLFFRDGQFTIYSPVGRIPCQGTGSTLQLALFHYDGNRKKIPLTSIEGIP